MYTYIFYYKVSGGPKEMIFFVCRVIIVIIIALDIVHSFGTVSFLTYFIQSDVYYSAVYSPYRAQHHIHGHGA